MDLLLVLALILGALVFFNIYLNRLPNIRSLENVPGPRIYPIIGCFFTVFGKGRDDIFRELRKLAVAFPRMFRMHTFNRSSVISLWPADIEILLSSMKFIKKSFPYRLLHVWLRDGLLISFGTKWQNRRKILTPAFHFNILQEFVKIFEEHSKDLVVQLRKECDKKETDIATISTSITLSALCETAMGTTLSSEAGADDYKNAIHRVGDIFVKRVISPWLWLPCLFKLFSEGREMAKCVDTLHSFTGRVISERRKGFIEVKQISNDEVEVVGRSKKRLAMLDLLLSAHGNGKIDEEGIREEVDTFMFEGHDTVSIALNFSLMCLANNPQIQEKVYEEVMEVLGNSEGLATIQDLQELRYLDQCIKESLRLYPSVPLISRELTNPITLSNLNFPVGQIVSIPIFSVHRNADIWEDPDKYDPDRFLPENCAKRHSFAYIPFSAGPRNCIGQKFAILEMKSIISNIVRNFKIEAVTKPEDIEFLLDIVLRTKEPIKIKFNARS